MAVIPDTHSVFTVIVPVTGPTDGVESTLATIGAAPATSTLLPFGLVDGLHFASVTLLGASAAVGVGRSLVIELNTDAPPSDTLAAILAVGAPGVDALLAATPGWPGAADGAALAFLTGHLHRPGAYHVGNTARTVAQVQLEARLWDHLQGFLDANPQLREADGRAIRAAMVESVAAVGDLAVALEPAASGSFPEAAPAGGLATTAKLVVRNGFGAVLRLLVRFPWLLVRELLERPDQSLADPPDLAAIEATEDLPRCVQNHLTSVVEVKGALVGRRRSRFRLHVLTNTLAAIEVLARRQFVDGELGGISSIHFAHWVVIDEGRRLLFLSNFDGSWESYLDDFIELAHLGLTAVWSNATGFPRTHALVVGGATHGEAFKRWARRSQQVTPVWYHAYPELSVNQIDVNSRVRTGLATPPADDQEMTAWLRLL